MVSLSRLVRFATHGLLRVGGGRATLGSRVVNVMSVMVDLLARAWRATVARYGRPEHTPAWELEHTELWLMARRQQLTEDLRRIERLLLHDELMSATRQLGNRLARDQLVASLARIPDVLPGRDRYFAYERVSYEPVAAFSSRSGSVEVLDVVGWR